MSQKTADFKMLPVHLDGWSRPGVKAPQICGARLTSDQAWRCYLFIYWRIRRTWTRTEERAKRWRVMFGEVLCPWRKCNVRYKECGNKTGNEGRKDEEEIKKSKNLNSRPPRPSGALTTTHDHKSRSGLCSIRSLCAYSCHMIPLRLPPPPPPPALFPFTYTVPVGGSKTTSYISAGGEREREGEGSR